MYPLVIGLGFIITWLLLPKKNNNSIMIAPTTGNMPIGITGGFPMPSVAQSTSLTPQSTQSNQPSTGGSGVPDYAPNTQEFNLGMGQPIAGILQPLSFYNPSIMKRVPASSSRMEEPPASSSCGCGGHKTQSDCNAAKRRSADTGCLATSTKTQLKNTPPTIFYNWADNIQNSDFGLFDVAQNIVNNFQQDNPPGYDLTPPAGTTRLDPMTALGIKV